jgi:hypothetical protein
MEQAPRRRLARGAQPWPRTAGASGSSGCSGRALTRSGCAASTTLRSSPTSGGASGGARRGEGSGSEGSDGRIAAVRRVGVHMLGLRFQSHGSARAHSHTHARTAQNAFSTLAPTQQSRASLEGYGRHCAGQHARIGAATANKPAVRGVSSWRCYKTDIMMPPSYYKTRRYPARRCNLCCTVGGPRHGHALPQRPLPRPGRPPGPGRCPPATPSSARCTPASSATRTAAAAGARGAGAGREGWGRAAPSRGGEAARSPSPGGPGDSGRAGPISLRR